MNPKANRQRMLEASWFPSFCFALRRVEGMTARVHVPAAWAPWLLYCCEFGEKALLPPAFLLQTMFETYGFEAAYIQVGALACHAR